MDIGVAKLFVLAVVALVVLGPERFTRTARTVGLLCGKARAQWQTVRADVERQIQHEEIARQAKEQAAYVSSVATEVRALGTDHRADAP